MLTCKEVTHLVSESLDRELPFPKRVGVRLHLAMCKFCRRYRRQMLFLRKACRDFQPKLEREEIPPFANLPPEVRERIQEAIESDTPPGSLPG